MARDDGGSGASSSSLVLYPLTDRERAVLAASADGAAIREIATALYLSTAIQKLGARNRVEAARLAEQKGWL